MAGEPGAAGANELTSPGRHAPLPTNAAARVPDPPICSPVRSAAVALDDAAKEQSVAPKPDPWD
jgi:hypothetical protein